MDQQTWTRVDRYFNERFVGDDAALRDCLQATHTAGMPTIEVAATEGKLLMLLARAVGARRILEIGTLGGYSAIWLARALPIGGRLISCELDAQHAEIARSNLQRAGLGDLVEIKVGAARQTLAQLINARVEPFDLVFIDADKGGYPDYLEAALQLTRPGALIVADNVVRDGRVADPSCTENSVPAMRRFLDRLASDPRLVATALQTVGERGYDGFAIALVTAGASGSRP